MENSSNISQPFLPCFLLERIYDMSNDVYYRFPLRKKALYVLYGLVITFGVCGNTVLISIILGTQRLRTVRNGFIIHLAFSDLLLCCLTAPSTLWMTLNNYWLFGDFSCKILASLQAANTFLSLLTLTAISWDRFLQTTWPVHWRSSCKTFVGLLICVWGLSLMFAAPYFFAVGVSEARYGMWNSSRMDGVLKNCNETRPYLCIEEFLMFDKRAYSLAIFGSQYVFPLSGLLLASWSIAQHTLRKRAKLHPRKKRTLLLLSLLVLSFGVCWLPSNLYCALDALQLIQYDQKLYIYFHLIGMLSTCINPLLYGLLNKNVKNSFKTLILRQQMIHKDKSVLMKEMKERMKMNGSSSMKSHKSVLKKRLTSTFSTKLLSRSSAKMRPRKRSYEVDEHRFYTSAACSMAEEGGNLL